MSKGMPSMAALLGLIAVAGYQNRDKLAAMYNEITSSSAKSPTTEAPKTDIMGGIATAVRQVVQSLNSAGQGETAESWVGTGRNQAIEQEKLEQAVGRETIDQLTRKTGLSRAEILRRLTADLPRAVDEFTPNGRLAT